MNLSIENEPRNGYTNVSIYDRPDIEFKEDWTILESVGPHSVDEITSATALNLLDDKGAEVTLSNWFYKLKEGGILRISVLNVDNVFVYYKLGSMNLQELHDILYGPNLQRKFIFTPEQIIYLLKRIGFKINTVNVEGIYTTIEARKQNEV